MAPKFKHGHKFRPGATFDGAGVRTVYEDGSAILKDGRTIDAETGRVKGRRPTPTADVATAAIRKQVKAQNEGQRDHEHRNPRKPRKRRRNV